MAALSPAGRLAGKSTSQQSSKRGCDRIEKLALVDVARPAEDKLEDNGGEGRDALAAGAAGRVKVSEEGGEGGIEDAAWFDRQLDPDQLQSAR